jgi:hypothetical protein
MCGAVGSFAFLDTTAKYLGRQIDVLQVVWAHYTFALLLTTGSPRHHCRRRSSIAS